MELFEKGLSLFQILDVARDVYPKLPEDEIWFLDYLKMKMETAFEADKTIFTQEQFLNYIGEAASFNRALVEIMVGILTDKITSTAKKESKREKVFSGITLTVMQ
jgi:regulator of sigma D